MACVSWGVSWGGGCGRLAQRHVCFHPGLPLLYTSDEQANSVSPYAIDLRPNAKAGGEGNGEGGGEGGGRLSPVRGGAVETVPADCTAPTNVSEIRISPGAASPPPPLPPASVGVARECSEAVGSQGVQRGYRGPENAVRLQRARECSEAAESQRVQ